MRERKKEKMQKLVEIEYDSIDVQLATNGQLRIRKRSQKVDEKLKHFFLTVGAARLEQYENINMLSIMITTNHEFSSFLPLKMLIKIMSCFFIEYCPDRSHRFQMKSEQRTHVNSNGNDVVLSGCVCLVLRALTATKVTIEIYNVNKYTYDSIESISFCYIYVYNIILNKTRL